MKRNIKNSCVYLSTVKPLCFQDCMQTSKQPAFFSWWLQGSSFLRCILFQVMKHYGLSWGVGRERSLKATRKSLPEALKMLQWKLFHCTKVNKDILKVHLHFPYLLKGCPQYPHNPQGTTETTDTKTVDIGVCLDFPFPNWKTAVVLETRKHQLYSITSGTLQFVLFKSK